MSGLYMLLRYAIGNSILYHINGIYLILLGIRCGYKPHLMRQFSDWTNMRNALQSRRDYMFIAPNVLNLFRSVGAIFL